MKCKIAELREEKGIKQKWLAEKLGVKYQQLSAWERGLNEPRASYLWEIAEILDCKVDDLYKKEKSLPD